MSHQGIFVFSIKELIIYYLTIVNLHDIKKHPGQVMISRHLWPPSFPTGEQTHLFRYKIHIINRAYDVLFSLLVDPNKDE